MFNVYNSLILKFVIKKYWRESLVGHRCCTADLLTIDIPVEDEVRHVDVVAHVDDAVAVHVGPASLKPAGTLPMM